MTTASNKKEHNKKLKQLTDLLKFAMSLNDEEIIKSTVESVIEQLEEEITKYQ